MPYAFSWYNSSLKKDHSFFLLFNDILKEGLFFWYNSCFLINFFNHITSFQTPLFDKTHPFLIPLRLLKTTWHGPFQASPETPKITAWSSSSNVWKHVRNVHCTTASPCKSPKRSQIACKGRCRGGAHIYIYIYLYIYTYIYIHIRLEKAWQI